MLHTKLVDVEERTAVVYFRTGLALLASEAGHMASSMERTHKVDMALYTAVDNPVDRLGWVDTAASCEVARLHGLVLSALVSYSWQLGP